MSAVSYELGTNIDDPAWNEISDSEACHNCGNICDDLCPDCGQCQDCCPWSYDLEVALCADMCLDARFGNEPDTYRCCECDFCKGGAEVCSPRFDECESPWWEYSGSAQLAAGSRLPAPEGAMCASCGGAAP